MISIGLSCLFCEREKVKKIQSVKKEKPSEGEKNEKKKTNHIYLCTFETPEIDIGITNDTTAIVGCFHSLKFMR